MRRLFLSSFLWLSVGTALAVQDCELNGQSVNPANGFTTQGKTGLMRCRDRDSGQLVREEELKGGKFVGLVRHFENGKLIRERSINDKGNSEGRARRFYADGRVATEENYANGTLIGLGREWHAHGALKRIAWHDSGRALAVVAFNDRGQLRELRCAERALLGNEVNEAQLCGHGARAAVMQALFDDKGRPRGRIGYLSGRRVAEETFWEDGKLRGQTAEDESGAWIERDFTREGAKRREVRWIGRDRERAKEYEREYHESGTLTREQRWGPEGLASDKTWYLNGQPRKEHRYVRQEGRAVCLITEYHDNGKPKIEGSYAVERGALTQALGLWRYRDVEGRLRKETEYDAKGRPKRERELDEQGKVVRDDALFEDGSRKAYEAPR